MKLEEDSERTVNSSTINRPNEYCTNLIKTSKYTWYTFLPINMYEQFSRVSNAYFLVLMILEIIPQISSLSPVTTIIPLFIVISLSAIKDIYDDFLRHRNDDQVNNRVCFIYRNGDYLPTKWRNVIVGDIIKLESEEKVPADIVLLGTSNDGLCLVETAELDGETNLKSHKSPTGIVDFLNKDNLDQFPIKVTCELPNKNLDKFDGRIQIGKNSSIPLSNDNVVLRGCLIRNTENVLGVVIFTGQDSKIMMNSGKLRLKRTHIDLYVNKVISQILIFLLICVIILVIGQGIWEKMIGINLRKYIPWAKFLSPDITIAIATKSLLSFFSFVIIMNAIIPISLYVSIEFIRFWNSMFVNWDVRMYDSITDTYAKARTTSLIEELGQIQYIFSDKTGTLTQNLMKFRKCSINGIKYEDSDISPLISKIGSGDNMVKLFMEILSICHTVMVSTTDGKFQAQSPDEGALVEAVSMFGYRFLGRTADQIQVEVGEQIKTYKLLAILEFDNFRKRMSVVIRNEGKILLLTKGADTTIFEILSNSDSKNLREATDNHLNEFAFSGLRTLCMAYKHIEEREWELWYSEYNKACLSILNRSENVQKAISDLEKNMKLVGATGIEDKLQENVSGTISSLISAKIHIWVLTGDKLETAVNIGYSCSLLTNDMLGVFTIEDVDMELVASKIKEYINEIKFILSQMDIDISAFTKACDQFSTEFDRIPGFALVITGQALDVALTHCEQAFVDLSSCCKTVICCRVTPLQKSQVVSLVKKHKKVITLSIGDGANDVSMIKSADIGVGISGKEGRQAVLASDYSISQFQFLERLVLSHGRLSYYRICRFLSYFFYKSFAFAFSQFIFAFFSAFSAQIVYNQIYMAFYNLVYTSVPVLVMGIFDKDLTNETLLTNPKLYDAGIRNKLFNQKVFLLSAFEGCVSSLVITLFTYFAMDGSVNSDGMNIDDIYTVQHVIMTLLTFVVTFRCALYMNTWTILHHISIWGSILVYFAVILFLSADIIHTNSIGTAYNMLETPTFWFLLPLVMMCLLMPVAIYKTIKFRFRPSFAQQLITSHSIIMPKSKCYKRSGYAFSQEDRIDCPTSTERRNIEI